MKKLLSLILVFSIIWSVCPALADALTLPDPAVVSGGGIKFVENRDNEHALYRAYSVTGDTAAQQVAPYLTALLQIPQLQLSLSFVENYSDYSGMYYVFAMIEGSCSTFAMGDKINNAAVVLYYDYGGNYAGHNIYLYCSTDFSIGGESASLTPAAPASVSADAQQTAVYSLADSLVLQDPITFSNGLAEFLFDYDKSSHLQKEYKFNKAKVEGFINAYVSLLKTDPSLEYLGVTVNGENIYHCFAPADGYSYKTFSVVSYGNQITPTSCIAVQYKNDSSRVYIRYSPDFSIADAGERMDGTRITVDTAAASGSSNSKTSTSSSSNSSSSSSSSWSSSSSSSSSQTRTKRCTKCSGDGKVSCSNCSGRGYKEKTVSTPNYSGKGVKYETVKENCYRCHGSGDVDCSTCGGDGKVEY